MPPPFLFFLFSNSPDLAKIQRLSSPPLLSPCPGASGPSPVTQGLPFSIWCSQGFLAPSAFRDPAHKLSLRSPFSSYTGHFWGVPSIAGLTCRTGSSSGESLASFLGLPDSVLGSGLDLLSCWISCDIQVLPYLQEVSFTWSYSYSHLACIHPYRLNSSQNVIVFCFLIT